MLGAAVGLDAIPEELRLKTLGFDCDSYNLMSVKRRRPEFLSVKTHF